MFLDVDDVTGFGPEVISIPRLPLPGTYRYVVRNFSGSPGIDAVARVELNSRGDVSVFSPPALDTQTDYWAVFNIEVDESLNMTVVNVQEWLSGLSPSSSALLSSAMTFSPSVQTLQTIESHSIEGTNPAVELKNEKYYVR